MAVAFALTIVLAFLCGLHVYWAFGGRWGWAVAIPQVNDRPAFTPSRLATALVAFGLGIAALVPLVQVGAFSVLAPTRLSQLAAWLLALVFLVRAVGDFHLVGFFKRIRSTSFGRRDTWLYSPLCLLLAAGFAHVASS